MLMKDFTGMSTEDINEIASCAEIEIDLMILAVEKFLPHNKENIEYIIEMADDLGYQAEREAQNRHLEGKESFDFRKNYIKNYVVEHDPL